MLRDQDEILVGKHHLIFLSEAQSPSQEVDEQAADLAEATVILAPKTHRHSGTQTAMDAAASRCQGELVMLDGDSNQERIPLAKRITVGGKSTTADVQLKGWFVAPRAFMISQKPSGFVITHSDGKRMTRVNGEVVSGQRDLQDGDLITIGATKLQFRSKSE